MPCILHIETATEICSVALSKQEEIIFEKIETKGRSHASILGVFVDDAVKFARTNELKIDAVAVSSGPGSYTGLRIGVSQAKGLCYGLNIPLIAIETLKVMTAGLVTRAHYEASNALFCPMIDARRMEVYDAVYDKNLEQVKPTSADVIDEASFADFLQNSQLVFFGNGSAKCKEMIQSENALFIDNFYPLASDMLDLALKAFEEKAFVDTAYFEPFYLKDFVATVAKNKVLSQ